MRSLMVAEVEAGGQTGLQLTHRVILVEIDVLVFDAAPQTFAEDVVEGAAAPIHADLNVGSEQASSPTAACGEKAGFQSGLKRHSFTVTARKAGPGSPYTQGVRTYNNR